MMNNFPEATDSEELLNSLYHTFVSTVQGLRGDVINQDITTTGAPVSDLNSAFYHSCRGAT